MFPHVASANANTNVRKHSILGPISDFCQQQALSGANQADNDDTTTLKLPPIFQTSASDKYYQKENLILDDRNDENRAPAAERLSSPTIPSLFTAASKKDPRRSNMRDLLRGQRIERAKETRKLQHLLKGDRIYATREQRILQRWDEQQKEWHALKKKMASKTGKKEDELVITRVEEWREMVEEIDLMSKSLPCDAMAPHRWQHSLRNTTGLEEDTHLVPVGGMFSGLYCKVRDNPRKLMKETVRRPRKLEAPPPPPPQTDTAGGTGSGDINLFQHHSGMPGTGAASKHWHEKSVTMQFRQKLHTKMRQLKPNNLEQVDGLEIVGYNMFMVDKIAVPSYSYERFQNAKPTGGRSSAQKSSRSSYLGDESYLHVNAQDDELRFIGPHVRCSPTQYIMFDTALYEEETKVFTIENAGTTAVLLQLENAQQTFVEDSDAAVFVYPTEQFSVLPGATKRVAFYFKPSKPGAYHLAIGLHSSPAVSTKSIEVHAVCRMHDEDRVHRDAFVDQFMQSKIEHDAALVMNSMLDAVDEHTTSGDKVNITKTFCERNRDHKVYWHPQILAELQSLSASLLSLFRRRKRNSYQWNLSVSMLNDWLTQLRSIHDDATLHPLRQQLEDCIQRAQQPPPPNPEYYELCSCLLNDLCLQMPRFAWRAAHLHKTDKAQQQADGQTLQQHCREYLCHILDQFENGIVDGDTIDNSIISPIQRKLNPQPVHVYGFGRWSTSMQATEIESFAQYGIQCMHSNSTTTILSSVHRLWMCSNDSALSSPFEVFPIWHGFNITQIFCCENMVSALTDTGDVYSSLCTDLCRYQTEVLFGQHVTKITGCAGSDKCVALCGNGHVYEWSASAVSQTIEASRNEETDEQNTTQEPEETSPTITTATHLSQIDVALTDVAITSDAYAAITADGELLLWGHYQTVYGDKEEVQVKEDASPAKPYLLIETLPSSPKYQQIVACANAFIVLDKSGDVYAFGQNEFGVLGLGREMDLSMQPKLIVFADNEVESGVKIQHVSSWMHGVMAVDTAERVWCWGEPFGGNPSNDEEEIAESGKQDQECKEAIYLPTKITTAPRRVSIAKSVSTNLGAFVWCADH